MTGVQSPLKRAFAAVRTRRPEGFAALARLASGIARRVRGSGAEPGTRTDLVIGAVVLLACIGGAITASLRTPAPRSGGNWWPLLSVVTIALQRFRFRLSTRGNSLLFDLSGLPLIVGIVLLSPSHELLAAVTGVGVWQVLDREPIRRAAFNIANQMVGIEVALWCFHRVAGAAGPLSGQGCAAIGVALIASEGMAALGVLPVMTAHSGWPGTKYLKDLALQIVVIPPVLFVLAIVAVASYEGQPWAMGLLAGPAVLVGWWYTTSERLRQRFTGLQALYGYSKALADVVEHTDVLVVALQETRTVLHCGRAAVCVSGSEGLVRYSLDAEGALVSEAAESDGPESTVVESQSPILLAASAGSPYLSERGLKDLMAVPMTVGRTTRAVLTVADSDGLEGHCFDHQDLDFLQAVAAHLSTALTSSEHLDKLRRSIAAREHQALHDALTGMPNRNLFMSEVTTALEHSGGSRMVAVVLADLDSFREVNDALGHQTGDAVLKVVGARVASAVSEYGVGARLGGDEFAFLVPAASSVEEVTSLTETVMEVLSAPMEIDGVTFNVRAAVGIALAPIHGLDAATLLKNADVAMYAAKRAGRRISVYDATMDHSSARRLALATNLAEAIDQNQLVLWYQPVADITTGTVTGFEALLRWPHPDLGFVSPEEFIPIAEQTGLIEPLTWWVMKEALGELRRWRDDGYEFSMAVNVSVRSLLDHSIVERIRRMVADFGLAPGSLTLEITESSMMIDLDRSESVLRRISDMGIKVGIDDFGTGYSSLSRLKVLPVHIVKVDRSFVKNICTDKGDQAIVRSVIELARVMGHKVVAEGIEDLATWSRLASLGCDLGQGYYFARPMPSADCRAWVTDRQSPSLAVVRSLSSKRVEGA
jgi:diguanylate cyclase (GGDEF)-like protein